MPYPMVRHSFLPVERPRPVNPSPHRPRLGVFAFHPIQYQVPLYQRLTERGRVRLEVLFISDAGLEPTLDPGFGQVISWNIDMLSGYRHDFLAMAAPRQPLVRRLRKLSRWLKQQDVVVIHGYASGWMLLATLICIIARRPYLLRGDSKPRGQSFGAVRRWVRNRVAHIVVSRSAGALTIGELNARFYREFGQPDLYWAPYSVDDRRFASPQAIGREELLASFGLPENQPLIVFVGKLIRIKRPLDVAEAHRRLSRAASVLYVGDGELRDEIEAAIGGVDARVTGFVNQLEMPAYYQAADIIVLPSEIEQWGLVINEAMAAGVVPVVSENVGCADDLVRGVGHVVPMGDVSALAQALDDVLERIHHDGTRTSVQERASQYSLDATASGFEAATESARTRRRT